MNLGPRRYAFRKVSRSLLKKPRDVERNWNLLYAVDRGSSYRG